MLLKPPKTIEEQISLLKSRNIIIDDIESVKVFLQNNNYYRLMGYAYQFKINEKNYQVNTNFSTLTEIYDFDKLLRQILFPLLEDFEVSFKTKLAYFLCHKYGAECHLKENIFKNLQYYFDFISTLLRNIKQSSKQLFIKHHNDKYDGRFPFWVLIEILSFSTISKLFKNLNNKDKSEFLKLHYSYDAIIFENWIEHFSVIRNICAHHDRIYNKNFNLKFLKEDHTDKTFKIFDSLYALSKVIPNRNLWSNSVRELAQIINEYKEKIDLNLLGFSIKNLNKIGIKL